MSGRNRTVVISGATGELGKTVAQALAERGYRLALLDRHSDRLAKLEKKLALPEMNILSRKVNLLNPEETKGAADAIAAKFGTVDILLHLIGGWTGGKTIVESPVEDLEFMLNQHVRTSFNVAKAFVPLMTRNKWGRMIAITSPFASRPGSKGGPYVIGKAGQEALMMTLAQELKGTGVTVNLLQVKTIDSKREKITAASTENSSWSTPEEITASILYLISDEAGTINGGKLPLFGSQQ
jgi:NAD(P)-dependent dehydrogenase (short-subunit alcohol dehydrogenase family)